MTSQTRIYLDAAKQSSFNTTLDLRIAAHNEHEQGNRMLLANIQRCIETAEELHSRICKLADGASDADIAGLLAMGERKEFVL